MRDLGPDIDTIESREWQDAIADVIERDGPNRAHFLLDRAVALARAAGATLPLAVWDGEIAPPSCRQPARAMAMADTARVDRKTAGFMRGS